MKIAIVEDDKLWSDLYVQWLGHAGAGHETEVFIDSSEETIRALLHRSFDVFLLDICLNRRDTAGGFRIMGRLLEHFGANRPPVIVLTGALHRRDLDVMRAMSVDEVSEKPDSALALTRFIDFVVQQRLLNEAACGEIRLLPFTAQNNCRRGRAHHVSLTASEMAVFHALLSRSPNSVDHQTLVGLLPDATTLNALYKTILALRSKLEKLYSAQEIQARSMSTRLVTVRDVGYAWQ